MLSDPNFTLMIGLVSGLIINLFTGALHQVWLGPLSSRFSNKISLKKTKSIEKQYFEMKRMREEKNELPLLLLLLFGKLSTLLILLILYHSLINFIIEYTKTEQSKMIESVKFIFDMLVCFTALKNIIYGADVYWKVKNFHTYKKQYEIN